MDSVLDAIIVGGGLSGLTCARKLTAAGLSCQLLEASDQVGGRARTDTVDGFLLDRGFQVFLTAYPEVQAILSYQELGLKSFDPGALIRFAGKFRRLVDPWRRPRHLLATALSPVASLRDKLRIAGSVLRLFALGNGNTGAGRVLVCYTYFFRSVPRWTGDLPYRTVHLVSSNQSTTMT